VAVTRDISEHRRRAEELEEARAAAECADRSKGRFLATVSHELRTPLNAIIGFSEILASDTLVRADDARRKEYAQIIHDSGQHLLGVVNTLLDLSKIESGKFEFVAEPLDLGELASASCDLMQLKAAQAGLTLARDIAREMPEIVADRRACRQIFINLLSNAVKFTPRGGCVTVSVRRESHRVLLIVADTGIGIAEEDLPKVGDPFFQAGSHYDRAHEGTGLGLSVVRGLVGLHRGTLTIESAPGEGTAVTVSLPLDCRAGAAQTGGPIPVRALKRSRPISGFDQRMKHRA
jgi:cell cycle sensor histidine kinase DivJ